MDRSAGTKGDTEFRSARIARLPRVRRRAVVVAVASAGLVASAWLFAETLIHQPTTEGIESWESLEEAIGAAMREAADVQQSMTFEGLSRVPAFVEVSRPEYEQAWHEMIHRGDLPLVALAGYRCIEAHDPSNAFGAALVALLSRTGEASLVFVAPMMERVNAGGSGDEDFDAFTRFLCSASWERQSQLAFTVSLVSDSFLYEWFHRPRSDAVPAWAEAYVLGHLFGTVNDDRPVTDAMNARLERFAAIPGVARLTFVLHADTSHDGFDVALARVIQDRSLGDAIVAICVSENRDYVREHPEILEGEISDARRQLIDKALAKD